MRWAVWWWLVALQARCRATSTVCEDESCHCDAFTRIVCHCTRSYDEVTLRPDGAYRVPSTTTAIMIDGCARVYFLPDTVQSLTQLRNVELKNIHHVYFGERSVAWSPYQREHELSNPGLHIKIQNCTINDISSHAFKGRIDDVTITESRINVIKPFAFASLTGVKNIELTDNVFDNIEIQAFKKFTTANFLMRGGFVKNIPSRFLSDVEITNSFRMDGVTVDSVSSLAFLASSPKRTLIEKNHFGTIEGDAFHIVTRGPVTFRYNTVTVLRKGAILGFSAERDVISDYGLQELLIDNNTITEMDPTSLIYNTTSFKLQVDGLNLNGVCECELGEVWREMITQQGAGITCWDTSNGRYLSVRSYVEDECGPLRQNYWIFILVGVIALLLLITVVLIVVVVRRRKAKKIKKLAIVMPEGKTYRETVIETIVERADLLTTDF